MAEGRRKLAWAQTAEILAMLFNGFFHPQEPLRAEVFDPTAQAITEAVVMEVPLSVLKMFTPEGISEIHHG